MCPDPQLLSIYLDGELPSPWKEKIEAHFTQCSGCKEKLENFKRLQKLFQKDTHIRRTYVEREAGQPSVVEDTGEEDDDAERVLIEPEMVEAAKDRVWRSIQSGQSLRHYSVWRRRLSVPLPVAAAAAIVLVFLAALWLRGGFSFGSAEPSARANFVLASEEEMPAIIPAADMNGVLQYLGSDGTDIIIMRLPESRSFLRSGEPEIINAAGYTRRRP